MRIEVFSSSMGMAVRDMVLGVLEGEGFGYDPVKDNDLDDIEGHYLKNRGIFYVALIGDEIVGTGAVRKVDDTRCEIKRIYVRKEWRKKGIGRQLFLKALDFSKGNYSKALLKTDPDLGDAIRLYLDNGFKPVRQEAGIAYFERELK